MSQKKLIKESILYTTGNILQKLGDFVFIPVFTYYLTVEEYGNLSLYLSIIPLLLLLFQQGTRTGFIRLYYDYDEKGQRSLYTTVLLYNIIVSTILIFIVFLFREDIFTLITNRMTFFPVGILILVIAFTNNLFQLNLAYFQVKHRSVFYVFYSLICFFCRYGLILGLVVIGKMGLNGYLIGYLGANIVLVFLPNMIFLLKRKLSFSIDCLISLLIFSLPVVPHLLSTWVYNLSSRLIVQKYVSIEEYAIFSLGANIALAFSVIVTSFSLAWGPHYLKIATQDPSNAASILKRDMVLVLKVFSLALVGFLMFSREIIFITGRNPVYHSAYKTMPFILLGYFFFLLYVVLINSFYLKKKTFTLSILSVLIGVLSIVNQIFCSKFLGIRGVACAMAINYFILFVTVAIFSQKLFPVPVLKAIAIACILNTALTISMCYFNDLFEVGIKFFAIKACVFVFLVFTISRPMLTQSIQFSKKNILSD